MNAKKLERPERLEYASLPAKERYALFFIEQLAAHPGVPPDRAVIAQRMGWKTSNHSGGAPQWRRDLMVEAGFRLLNGRWVNPLAKLPVDRTPEAVEQWLASDATGKP